MGIKDGTNAKAATNFASKSRTAKAGAFDGGRPNPGPKPEPVKVNGVPRVKERGVSKK